MPSFDLDSHIRELSKTDPLGIETPLETIGDLLLCLAQWPASGWAFRGQSDISWPLKTRLQRELEQSGKPRDEWREAENSILREFRDSALSEIPAPPPSSDLAGWLAIMQQYGGATRLLDWSGSPFVSLYFAVKDPTNTDAALWAINVAHLRSMIGSTTMDMGWADEFALGRVTEHRADGSKHERFELYGPDQWRNGVNRVIRTLMDQTFAFPLPVLPLYLDSRMKAQQALFTLDTALETSIEAALQSICRGKREELDRWKKTMPGIALPGALEHSRSIIMKIPVKNAWRLEIMTALERMNITRGTLFPGLGGVGGAALERIQRGSPPTMRDQLLP